MITKCETNREVLSFLLDAPEEYFSSPKMQANDRTFWQRGYQETWVFYTGTPHALTRYRPGEMPMDFDVAAYIDAVR